MKHEAQQRPHFFHVTAPLPCPYFDDRLERRVVTELSGPDAASFHDFLSLSGFRRSHTVAYAPACPQCSECVPVRVIVDHFHPSKSQRRVIAANRDVTVEERPAVASREQFELFTRYQNARHGGGDMTRMDFADYRSLIEDTPVESLVLEFRGTVGRLLGACLTDRMGDGLSAVYSFFEPDQPKRGLGGLMILKLVERCRELGLPYLYLGFWIEKSAKMSYKTNYRPFELLTPDGWTAPE